MTGPLRTMGLPAVALALVGGVLGVQLAYGGGEFEPLRPADPCVAREVTSQSDGIDGLTRGMGFHDNDHDGLLKSAER